MKPRWWSFRIWTGMTAGNWWRLVARHGFRISPSRLGQAASMLSIGPLCSAVAAVQRRKLGAAIDAESPPPLVFILGHWRSGTTFLHELMGTDRRFIAPTTLECFATDHYLRWGDFLARLQWAIQARRPMDDMAMGWHRPQEDEFALFAMGVPSPYDVMAFPNDRPAIVPNLQVGDMKPADQAAWKDALRRVVRRISYGRRRALKPGEAMPSYLLLKSPTHTARIGVLAEMFPDAKFVHIARDPHEVYASTERLWRATFDSQGLQKLDPSADLSSFILGTLPNMYRDFDRDVARLAPGRWTELRYEDLVADPSAKVADVAHALDLGQVDEAALTAHLAGVKGHRRNRHVMDPVLSERIRSAWAWYFERFGYARGREPMDAPARPPVYAWPVAGIEESSAEAGRYLADEFVRLVAMQPDWTLNDAIPVRVSAGDLSLRFRIGASDDELRLTVGPSGWIEVKGVLGGGTFRGFLERHYEEFELWPPEAGGAEGEAPGRIGKRGNWISLSVAAWPSLRTAIPSGESLVLEASGTVSSLGGKTL